MKIVRKSGIFLLLLLFSLNRNIHAQNKSLRFEHISSGQGLSNDQVISTLQDHEGYIWIGTVDGLNKYDGYVFTKYRFDPFDSTSLSQNSINTIWEDKKGSIWVGTLEGLCRFDRYTGKFTRYKPYSDEKITNPNIDAINDDTDGMIWVGDGTGGLYRFDPQTGKFLPDIFDLGFHPMPGNQSKLHDLIYCIYKDRSGTIWVGNRAGLHELKLTKVKTGQPSVVSITNYQNIPGNPNSLSNDNVNSILEDHDGIIWITTANGLNSLDRKKALFTRYQHDPKNVHSISSNNLDAGGWIGNRIAEEKNGNLWISTDSGLNKLNRSRDVFTSYIHNAADVYNLSSDIDDILIDRSGILWTGSTSKGLSKANLYQNVFGLVRHDPDHINSLSNNEVTAILEDSSGIVWIGTCGGGLNRWDKKKNEFTHLRHEPNNPKTLRCDTVDGILEDRHGHLWICNGDVLSQFNKQTGEFTHYNSDPENYEEAYYRFIYSITEDREGLLWLGTGNGVKNFNEKTGKFKQYYYNPADSNGISDYSALAIFTDSRDNIWVGHGSIATDKLNKQTGRFAHYAFDPHDPTSISSNIVKSFYEDSNGNLWMGTKGGGLCNFNYPKEKFTTFTDKYGLPSNTVFSVLQDTKGQFWLGTGNGLSRFDPVTKTFTNYDVKDGLQSNVFAVEFGHSSAYFRGKDGTLYFGGPEGFNFFDPAQLIINTELAPVVITQFKLFDKLVTGANESKEIILNHDENYFSFEFSSLSYYNPGKNQYAYKLEGVDKDWVYSGSRHYAGYTNIEPGAYTFKVKGTNNDGIWNEKGVSVSILIKPPWWSTSWAYCFYAICFIAGIFLLDRYQRKIASNKERESVRERELEHAHEIDKAYHELKTIQAQLIQSEKKASLGELAAQMNPHFIFNCLSSINSFVLDNKTDTASDYLTKFSKLIRTVLGNSKKSLISLEDELEMLRLYLEMEMLRFKNAFTYCVELEKNIDMTEIFIPPLLLQPFAENAIWHGLMHKEGPGRLDIRINVKDHILTCVITDDGVGRSFAMALRGGPGKKKSMGLQITRQRMGLINGDKLDAANSFCIEDLYNKEGRASGTRVSLNIRFMETMEENF